MRCPIPSPFLLKAAEHEVFESHAAHLPEFALLRIDVQAAVAGVVEGESDFEQLRGLFVGGTTVGLTIANHDGMIGEGEDYGALEFAGFEKDGEGVDVVGHGEFVGRNVWAERVAGCHIFFNFGAKRGEDFRQSAGGALSNPIVGSGIVDVGFCWPRGFSWSVWFAGGGGFSFFFGRVVGAFVFWALLFVWHGVDAFGTLESA